MSGLPPNLRIDANGAVLPVDPAGRALLKDAMGSWRTWRAGSLLVLALDEGTGGMAREGEKLALAGDLSTMPLLGLMNMLGQSRETGRLLIKRGTSERVVLMQNGDVVSIGSNLPQDRLGAFLVRLGRLSQEQVDRASREAAFSGKRIGQVLVASGLLDAAKLWSAIREQITDVFADVVQWSEGSFVLFRLPTAFQFPTTPPLSMQGLLLEAVRRADEMSIYRERIPSVHARLRAVKDAPAHDLDDDAQRALAAVGEESTVADVARRMQVPEFDATRLCYQLLKAGLVEFVKLKENAALTLRPDDVERVATFNRAFLEIYEEVQHSGYVEPFGIGVRTFLTDEKSAYADVFRGIVPGVDGTLSLEALARNLTKLSGTQAPAALMSEALNELVFFMLFQCGEFLDAQRDERLGQRVRAILTSIGT